MFRPKKRPLKVAILRAAGRFGATLAFLATALLPSAISQVPVALSPVPKLQFFAANGTPLAGGCVQTFNAGTTTQAATYVDSAGLFQNSNPITLDAGGFATIYLANQSYKIQVNAAPSSGACSSVNLGNLVYTQDNVSSYQQFAQINAITLIGATSDPVGSAGEIAYRSDLPCLRLFTTLWDCLVTQNGVFSFQNKEFNVDTNKLDSITNASGLYLRNNGTQYLGTNILQQDIAPLITNEGVTGTFTGLLTKLSAGTAIRASIGDTGGIIGICVASCGTTSQASIQQIGQAVCTFDGAATANDYFQISQSVNGDCHDAGSVFPATNGQVLGRVTQTTGGAGSANVILFGGEIKAAGNTVAKIDLAAQGANIGATTLYAVPATLGGLYRVSCYTTVTQAATTSSTLPQCGITWTDNDTTTADGPLLITVNNSGNTLASQGNATTTHYGVLTINAKASTTIQYSTSGYASVGGTSMQYAIHIRVEGPL